MNLSLNVSQYYKSDLTREDAPIVFTFNKTLIKFVFIAKLNDIMLKGGNQIQLTSIIFPDKYENHDFIDSY